MQIVWGQIRKSPPPPQDICLCASYVKQNIMSLPTICPPKKVMFPTSKNSATHCDSVCLDHHPPH